MSIYCCYKDCQNVQRSFSSKTFFNLPNDSRRDAWIKNSGNIELYGITTQRRLFCEDHFDPKYLRCQFNRTTLRRDAVPYAHGDINDSEEIEYIEMEAVDDESEERTEETQADASEVTSDQNNVTILLNSSLYPRISADNTIQMVKKPKAADLTAARKILKKYSNRLQHHPSTDDNNEIELEVDLIVVDDKKTDQTSESNETEQTSTNCKRLRLEVEPLINQPNESSPSVENESEGPSVSQPANLSQTQSQLQPHQQSQLQPQSQPPRKSIEEIVSSSEAFDTNSEDKYFALSILGTLRRLTPHKRALARNHILSYLTEIEYGSSNSTT